MRQESWERLSEEQIKALRLKYFDIAADAAYVFSFTDGRILDANKHASELLGYTRDELLELTVFDIHPQEERDRMLELIKTFDRYGKITNVDDMHLKRKDSSLVPVEKNGTLFTLDGRKLIQCTCRDITARKKIETELNRRIEDMHILREIGLEITSGLELDKLLPRITQNAVTVLDADAGAIGLYDERRDTLIYRYLYNLPEGLARYEIPRGAGITSYVIGTGRSIAIEDYLKYPKALEPFKEADIRAIVAAPLVIENRILGTLITMHKNPGKRFSDYDVGVLESIAQQASIAIYNAQLFEEMKDEGDFRQALYQITSLIGSALDLNKVYGLICEESTKLFRNTGTYLYMVDRDRNVLIGRAAYGEHASEFLNVVLPISEPSIASYIYHTRRAILVDDVETSPLVRHDVRRKFRSKTLMGVPIIVNGEVASILIFASSEQPYFFSETQVERAKILSNQLAFAVKNADLYEQTKRALEHERYVALTLQNSLLPERIPSIEGLDIAAYYAPMRGEGTLVGGDFYDFIQLPDKRLAIVIRDVSGKGIEAAAVTSMVKYAIRAFVYTDPQPASVLTQANSVVSRQLKTGFFVSLCCGLYEPETGKFTLANAGHPYPILCTPSEHKNNLVETSNPVFGIVQDFKYSQVELILADKDVMVLYTDGLIEAKAGDELFGVERALSSVRNSCNLKAQDVAMNLVNDSRVFTDDNLVDDVAIIVLKREPAS